MRYIIFVFLLISFSAKSQYVFPAYGDSVKWNVLEEFWGNGQTVTHFFVSDTIICGEKYSVTDQGIGVRSDSLKVYYRPVIRGTPTPCTDPDLILYDFGLSLNDTIHLKYQVGHGNVRYKVIESDTIQYLGYNRRHLRLFPLDGTKAQHWTQGIGSDIHPFYIMDELRSWSETDWRTLCTDSAGILIQKWKTCDTLYYLGKEEFLINEPIIIYPNPVQSTLYINVIDEISSIVIVDMKGQVINTKYDQQMIDVSDLSSGMYSIRIHLINGRQIQRIFIKN